MISTQRNFPLSTFGRRLLSGVLAAAFIAGVTALVPATGAGVAKAADARAESQETWEVTKPDLFGDREIADGTSLISLDAPQRAEDAALVPITVNATHRQNDETITAITLVVDNNPVARVATFHFSKANGVASIGTRIRIHSYAYVRAIAETAGGKLYMVRKFVKATGGCSAPATKDKLAALAHIGQMKFRQRAPRDIAPALAKGLVEAKLNIRHPNYSGMQKDQITHYYIPAHFVNAIEVRQGDETILSVDATFGLSEDPMVRFYFKPKPGAKITVSASDNKGGDFTKTWPVEVASGS